MRTSISLQYRNDRQRHWDAVARQLDSWEGAGKTYQEMLASCYRQHIPRDVSILELGCGRGDLLASLEPSFGVGVDFSTEMLKRATQRYPDLHFVSGDVHQLPLAHPFDYVIVSDLVNDLWDVQAFFENLKPVVHSGTRIIINTHSRLWQPILQAAQKLRLSTPLLPQNWFTTEDVRNLLFLSGFEVVWSSKEILFPLRIPGVTALLNRFLARIWPFSHLTVANFIIARPLCSSMQSDALDDWSVSVIIPARNEAGNIAAIFERLPAMGAGTEMIFVEGGSMDETYAVIEKHIQQNPEKRCKLLKQTGTGKADAVRLGFEHAQGDVLMILDADLTVPPESLPRFYQALVSGKAEFVNGVRLVYPLEDQAMRFANLVGNKFFSLVFSWLLGQPVKDTLCGTKVLWRKDYLRIAKNRALFGDFDPFGDYDLLFGASKLSLRIVDLPVRYGGRTYGTTNINRWHHGWLLLKMVFFAALHLKFV